MIIKKYSKILFVSLVLCRFVLLQAAESQPALEKKSRINLVAHECRQWFNKYILDYNPDFLGTENLAPEREEYIRSIIKRLGITKKIIIKKMNLNSIFTFGAENAFAHWDHLFVSEAFFKQLSEEEQLFLIGHELMHIEKSHSWKLLASSYAAICFQLTPLIDYCWQQKYINSITKLVVSSFGIRVAALFAHTAFRRACEREADKEAVKRLNCAQGGIKFIERLDKLRPPQPQQNYLEHKIAQLLSTHPTHKERIEYFKNLI